MENLNSFWHWFVIAITVGSILGCWWLLHWTKGVGGGPEEKPSDADDTGHVWDDNIHELNTPLPRWWLWLFNITIVFGLVYLAIFPGLGNIAGLVGWTQESQYEKEMAAAAEAQEAVFARFRDMTPEQLIADTEAREIGGRLFGNNCAMCHGSDGRGARGFPNLTDDDWQWGSGEQNIVATLTNGRMAVMTPWAQILGSDEAVTNMARYVRSLSGLEEADEAVQAMQQQFTMYCAACHTPAGTGNQVLGAPNLTDDVWLYGSSLDTIRETLIKGRNGQMPAHGEMLGENRTKILAAYVQSLSR